MKSKHLALTTVPVAGRGDLQLGVRLEDVNGDGKADIVFSLAGSDVFRISDAAGALQEFAGNVKAEAGRVARRIRKARKK